MNIDPEGQTEMTETTNSVRASLQYLAAADDGGAVYHASQAGGAAAEHDGSYDYREMEVRNGRDHSFDLDKAGFMLVPHASKLSDFHDDDAIATIYEDEARALVSRIIGARRVVIFDHTRRAASDGLRRAQTCLLYTSPSPRDMRRSRMPSSA